MRAEQKRFLALVAVMLLSLFAFLAVNILAQREFWWDEAILGFVHHYSTPIRDFVMVVVTRAGGSYGVLSLAAIAILWLLALRRWNQALFVAVAYCGAEILHLSLKAIFRRERPDLWISPAPEYSFSFPSGHALISATVLMALMMLWWRTRWQWHAVAAGALATIAVGFSRVYLGVHYPSDVLASWSLAVSWLAILGIVAVEPDREGRPSFRWTRACLCLVLLTVLPLGYVGHAFATDNVRVLVKNEAYRSGQMTGPSLEHCIRKYGIKSVFNLRGMNEGQGWYQQELKVCAGLNVAHCDFPLGSGTEVTVDELDRIADVLRSTPKPVLIHCWGGADRTGLVSALYLYRITGRPPQRAARELSVWYGHIPFIRSRVRAMDDSFQRYLAAKEQAISSKPTTMPASENGR
jgi:membrane-associated phospholipid phosphatase/protein tyrosine/serine phosphatase